MKGKQIIFDFDAEENKPPPSPKGDPESVLIEGLNEEQRKAVFSMASRMLLIGVPGSGKTTTIIRKIAFLVKVKKVDPKKILAVTFTNKAAHEMRNRIDDYLGYSFEGTIKTCHSWCAHFLKYYGHYIGIPKDYVIFDTNDSLRIVEGIVKEGMPEVVLKDMAESKIKKIAEEAFTAITKLKHLCVYPDVYEKDNKLQQKYGVASDIYKKYQTSLERQKAIDFAGLLLCTLAVFQKDSKVAEDVRKNYEWIFFDEYQDSNYAQKRVIHYLLGEEQSFLAAGDDDQSIYFFMGAHPENLVNFEKDFPSGEILVLGKNYRNPEEILNAATASILNNEGERLPKNISSHSGRNWEIKLIESRCSASQKSSIIDLIKKLIDEDRFEYKDIAILSRINKLLIPLKGAFIYEGIPAVSADGRGFFNSPYIHRLLAYFKLVGNSKNDVAAAEALQYPPRRIGDQTIWALLKSRKEQQVNLFELLTCVDAGEMFGEIEPQAEAIFPNELSSIKENVREFLRHVEALEKSKSLVSFLEYLLNFVGFDHWISQNLKDSEFINSRIGLLKNFLQNFEKEQLEKTEDYENLSAKEKIGILLEKIALSDEQDSVEKNGDTNAVKLLTMHASKGMEFPVVIVIGFCQGVLPFSLALEEGALSEERRVCYVAVTRAKQRLYLYCNYNELGHERDISQFYSEMFSGN